MTYSRGFSFQGEL